MTDQAEHMMKQFDDAYNFTQQILSAMRTAQEIASKQAEEIKQLKHRCEVFEASEKRFTETIEEQAKQYETKIAELEKKLNRKAYEKKYKEENKEKIKKQNKEYKEKKKEMIKSKGAEIVHCPCSKTHRYDNTRRHKMSAFHQKWLEESKAQTLTNTDVVNT